MSLKVFWALSRDINPIEVPLGRMVEFEFATVVSLNLPEIVANYIK